MGSTSRSALAVALMGATLAGCLDLATDLQHDLVSRENIVQLGPKPNEVVPAPAEDGGTDAGSAADSGTPLDGGATPTGCTAYEPNNSIATATPLAAGSYPALSICGNELDVFKLQVPAQSVVSARIKFNHAAGDLDLYLSDGSLDAQGYISTYGSSTSHSFSEEEILNEPHATAATAYLIVSGTSGGQGSYDLEVKIEPGVADRDCFTNCAQMIQLTGATSWGTSQANADGYYIYTPLKYAWGRRDLLGLLRYATKQVQLRFPASANDAVALSDVCQQDGQIPGTDVGSPRHPTNTHVRGKDVDVAYYQTDGRSNYQIICGAGTDTNGNGYAGSYNDGYFCTTTNNVVDVPRQVFFLAKLAESPNYRVTGVDQTLVTSFKAEALKLWQDGAIGVRQYRRITEGLGFGASGGWQFHHHHIHFSTYE